MSDLKVQLYNQSRPPTRSNYNARVPAARWESLKPVLAALFSLGKTQKEILNVLEQEYQFTPSPAQLHAQLVRWQLRRYKPRVVESQSGDPGSQPTSSANDTTTSTRLATPVTDDEPKNNSSWSILTMPSPTARNSPTGRARISIRGIDTITMCSSALVVPSGSFDFQFDTSVLTKRMESTLATSIDALSIDPSLAHETGVRVRILEAEAVILQSLRETLTSTSIFLAYDLFTLCLILVLATASFRDREWAATKQHFEAAVKIFQNIRKQHDERSSMCVAKFEYIMKCFGYFIDLAEFEKISELGFPTEHSANLAPLLLGSDLIVWGAMVSVVRLATTIANRWITEDVKLSVAQSHAFKNAHQVRQQRLMASQSQLEQSQVMLENNYNLPLEWRGKLRDSAGMLHCSIDYLHPDPDLVQILVSQEQQTET